MFRKSRASTVKITPVRPAVDPAPAAAAADRGLLRRTLGRGSYSRRTFGRGSYSRRTFGKGTYSRRTF